MTAFGAIFEVNSSIGKLWDLLGHFDEKSAIDFKNTVFTMLYLHTRIVQFLPKLFITILFGWCTSLTCTHSDPPKQFGLGIW